MIIFFLLVILLSISIYFLVSFLMKKIFYKKNIENILERILIDSNANIVFIVKSDVRPLNAINFYIPFYKHKNKKNIQLKFENIKMDEESVEVLKAAKLYGVVKTEVNSLPPGEIKTTLEERETEYFEIHYLSSERDIFYVCFVESNNSNRFDELIQRKSINNGVKILKNIFN